MQITSTRYMSIELREAEINAMRAVAKLAQEKLSESPITPMRGCPLFRQAGMFGQELNNTNALIEKILSETEYLNQF